MPVTPIARGSKIATGINVFTLPPDRHQALIETLTAINREILAHKYPMIVSANFHRAVDAPIIIRNKSGIRPAERALNSVFRKFHAGCHPANLGRPFAEYVSQFSRELESKGFLFNLEMAAREPGRFQIEVHPHAASVNLFRLPRIVKYKRGIREERAKELNRFRGLLLNRLPRLEPATNRFHLPAVPGRGKTKDVEDQFDAVLCAYIAAHWWYWGKARNKVFGDRETGFIVVPNLRP